MPEENENPTEEQQEITSTPPNVQESTQSFQHPNTITYPTVTDALRYTSRILKAPI